MGRVVVLAAISSSSWSSSSLSYSCRSSTVVFRDATTSNASAINSDNNNNNNYAQTSIQAFRQLTVCQGYPLHSCYHGRQLSSSPLSLPLFCSLLPLFVVSVSILHLVQILLHVANRPKSSKLLIQSWPAPSLAVSSRTPDVLICKAQSFRVSPNC